MPLDSADTILPRLIRMEEKLDSHLFRTATVESRVEAHDTRLRLLEQGNAKMVAIAGAVALAVSAFGSTLVGLIH